MPASLLDVVELQERLARRGSTTLRTRSTVLTLIAHLLLALALFGPPVKRKAWARPTPGSDQPGPPPRNECGGLEYNHVHLDGSADAEAATAPSARTTASPVTATSAWRRSMPPGTRRWPRAADVEVLLDHRPVDGVVHVAEHVEVGEPWRPRGPWALGGRIGVGEPGGDLAPGRGLGPARRRTTAAASSGDRSRGRHGSTATPPRSGPPVADDGGAPLGPPASDARPPRRERQGLPEDGAPLVGPTRRARDPRHRVIADGVGASSLATSCR